MQAHRNLVARMDTTMSNEQRDKPCPFGPSAFLLKACAMAVMVASKTDEGDNPEPAPKRRKTSESLDAGMPLLPAAMECVY